MPSLKPDQVPTGTKKLLRRNIFDWFEKKTGQVLNRSGYWDSPNADSETFNKFEKTMSHLDLAALLNKIYRRSCLIFSYFQASTFYTWIMSQLNFWPVEAKHQKRNLCKGAETTVYSS